MQAFEKVLLALIVMALSTTAGCVDRPGSDKEADPEVDVGSIPTETPFTLTGCEESILMFNLDPETAQQALPEGFQAADAQEWLGAPAPTGYSMLVVTTFACEQTSLFEGPYDESHVAITVEPPDVEGDQGDAIHLYVLAAATGQTDVRDIHERYAWEVYGDKITLDTAHSPVFSGSARVADEDGDVVTFDTTALPVPLEIQGTYRWWHLSDMGLSYVDYEIEFDTHAGPVSCSVRPGTIIATVTGKTDCDPVETLGATNDPFDTSGTWIFIGPLIR